MVTNEIVQPLVEGQYHVREYDFNMDNIKVPLSKHLAFGTNARFDNNGIFGDTFDKKKDSRFG